MCASRSSRCSIGTWATTNTGRRRSSGRWWRQAGWAGRAGAGSMSIAIETPGLTETQRQIVELADRKSTRLNSSHSQISYAVFCLKKKIHEDADVTSTIDGLRVEVGAEFS